MQASTALAPAVLVVDTEPTNYQYEVQKWGARGKNSVRERELDRI